MEEMEFVDSRGEAKEGKSNRGRESEEREMVKTREEAKEGRSKRGRDMKKGNGRK